MGANLFINGKTMIKKLPIRLLKKKVLACLKLPDFEAGMEQICRFPHRQVVNPLFSFLYSLDDQVKWRAISAMGTVIDALAHQDLEGARIVMRRFIWNLNDESGGIGWGSPEAMGETMARNRRLAEEYVDIFISYIRQDGNYLELEDLQKGVIWGIGRLAHARPELTKGAAAHLLPYIQSQDPVLQGLAVWAAGAFPTAANRLAVKELVQRSEKLRIYLNGSFIEYTVGQLAQKLTE